MLTSIIVVTKTGKMIFGRFVAINTACIGYFCPTNRRIDMSKMKFMVIKSKENTAIENGEYGTSQDHHYFIKCN